MLPQTGKVGLGRAGATPAPTWVEGQSWPKPVPGRWLTRGKQGLWPRAESRGWPPQEFIKAEPQDSLRTPIRKKAMLACTYLVYPFFLGMRGSLWGGCPHTCCLGKGCGMGLERLRALNSGLSSLEPALDKQVQADTVHSCLHSVMSVLPEPEGQDDHQEVMHMSVGDSGQPLGWRAHACGWRPVSS